ncbi:MAG: ABC transporter ATP-binding protein [Clostridia bacterium]|nr:ABC transporter ATP-binding protein [Clostridia bacterium]MBR2176291.1 ABC transporter ATP-binding protein [Clostridia bacterium]
MKISAKHLSKRYHQGNIEVEALKPCTFAINDGEQIAITGTSGSGKSTLLHLLGGLEQATDGSILYDDANFSKMSQSQCDDFRLEHIGIVFQSFNLLPELTAYENIVLPLMLQNKKIDQEYADTIIERLELENRLNHLPGQLSGGQQQRVALARALINRPCLLLCDEPTGNLDKRNTQSVTELLFEMSKEFSVTLLVVTHDEAIAKKFSRVMTISDGILGGDIS